ncbi:GRIP and coiled-coil domain-containing protein 1-like [Mya arenaria]|uniref:GRIP and coiled-coil domain-containing protein 1-like n=1 Tax=Mya arenaria TaxID=6604 RepID=UPI0022E09C45|nr:GRIP and coiled-coil domain-containing protein 1-like [Mya arenaria]XP_052778185.1 GRIP and coiled-coil domain-containing protein 1-like [Mya arenaria]XP_052778186.1 GRIP and coiled-coil domain-containing protein 1-like [Mya arenaria]
MDLERAPRSELLKKIEEQKEKLQNREKKLRDLIGAYKGVLKEKEALESSVKVLSQGQRSRSNLEVPNSKGPPSDTASDRGLDSDRESEDGAKPFHHAGDPLNAEHEEAEDVISKLTAQVETLSHSMMTLTEQKSKLEANYIAEKKAIKQENEDLQRRLKESLEKAESLQKQVDSQTNEWKGRIRGQQIEREKEQTDHAVMLRELQKLLASERETKEHLEQQLDETTFSLKEQRQATQEIQARHIEETERLKRDISQLKASLDEEKTQALRPSPQLLSLQRETEELKAQHRLLQREDESRVEEVESKARDYGKQCETRIAELESKLSELSETVGNYERLRYQDQQTIQRLKDRLSQLEQENRALTEASQSASEEEMTDIPKIVEKISVLKEQLLAANSRTEQPINIEELLLADTGAEHPLVKKYREELEQVKEEFERYRLRAQSVLKNKKENMPTQEDVLKEHVNELRDRLRTLHVQQDEELEHCRQREDGVRKTMLALQDKHKHEVLHMQAEHHSALQELEEEMKKQRERTVSMLAEKDRELEVLRATSTHSLQHDYVVRTRSNLESGGASCERQSSEDEAVTRLLATPPAGQGDMTLLYFAQEQARKDVEVATLRKQKRELEMALRDLQVSSSSKQEALYEEIDSLKEEIRKLGRSISREGANLEYLKNVTYKFLICHDPVGKQQMLNAITTILQFSPQEKSTVQAQNKGWWMGSS